jgi:hypothetical protein
MRMLRSLDGASGLNARAYFPPKEKPRQFSRRGERCDQRELRTADRVFILRQRSTSGKIPPLSAKNVPDAVG